MGLYSKGSCTLRRAYALGQVPTPEDVQKGLTENRFRPFVDGTEERRCGWAHWSNIEREADLSSSEVEGCYLFACRVDVRKVPGALLKVRIQDAIEKQGGFLGREQRAALKEEIRAKLMEEVVPTPKALEVAWNPKTGLVLSTATSVQDWSDLAQGFRSTWDLYLQPQGPLGMAERLVKPGFSAALKDMEPLALHDGSCVAEDSKTLAFLGEEFLVWLWHRGAECGGTANDEDGETALFLQDSLRLISETGDVQQATFKKGNPSSSQAAFEALRAGMSLVQGQVALTLDSMTWETTLSAGALDFSGTKLPKPEGLINKGLAGVAQARIELIMTLDRQIDARFETFLEERIQDPEAMVERLREWASRCQASVE